MIDIKRLNIPDSNGVYKYFDKTNKLIYVGKAKSLLNRISSYFTGIKDNKTKTLVTNINKIEWILTNSEFESLQLENFLIKENQPKYNILLKDDKSYPYIVIKDEDFSRVYHVRKKLNDNSEYFGPYPSSKYCQSLISLIEDLYPLRNCNLKLTKSNINSGKFKSCIQKQIGKCLAPCINEQSLTHYNLNLSSIRKILNGDIEYIIEVINKLITHHSSKLEFEKCQELKLKLDIIESFKSKFSISSDLENKEVFVIIESDTSFYINYLFVVKGFINKSINTKINKTLNESMEDVLSHYILYIRDKYNLKTNNIISNINIQINGINSSTIDELIGFSTRDLKHYILLDKISEPTTTDVMLDGVRKDLRLKTNPYHIECFDNSNLQGTNAVSSVVVFKNGKPSKKDYRYYNVEGDKIDDYDTMYKAVKKRYANCTELPNLIVIDGGKGQLSSAIKALKELNLYGLVSIISIAKKLEEIYYPEDSIPMYLNKRSYTLRLIQQIRDEAHRFGITKHRNKRSKNMLD